MGTELIQKATDCFQRKQRKCLDALEEPDLFMSIPRLSIALIATPVPDHHFNVDDDYRLALFKDHLVVIRGVGIVGEVNSPPASVVDRMKVMCPSLAARVLKVFALTGKAEILLEQL